MNAAKLATRDGAMGLGAALTEVFPAGNAPTLLDT